MKNLKYILIPILIALTGCDKQPDVLKKSEASEDDKAIAQAQFEQADKKIGIYLDKLDSTETAQKERVQILCVDYPTLYKTKYMPALLKLQPNAYTKEKLLKDLDSALSFYKKGSNINC